MATEIATKDWPAGVIQTVCSRLDDPQRVRRPEPIDKKCADCGAAIVLHAATVRASVLRYPGLPIRTICVECLVQYRHPDILHDLRPAPNSRPCSCTSVCAKEGLRAGWHCVLEEQKEIKFPAGKQ